MLEIGALSVWHELEGEVLKPWLKPHKIADHNS
jgi:hypothetical protein